MDDAVVVLVTCGTATEADRIAWSLVDGRLAGCVQVLENKVRSTYCWKDKVESAAEFLLFIKTSRRHFAEVEAEVKRLHSYETPEVIALPIAAGSKEYLAWLGESLREPGETGKQQSKEKKAGE